MARAGHGSKGNIKRLSVLKPKWAWSWQGNTTANEIAMALSGCRSAIGQFGAKICAPMRRSQSCVQTSHVQQPIHVPWQRDQL